MDEFDKWDNARHFYKSDYEFDNEAQAEIDRLQAEVERLTALSEELDGANIVNRNAIRMQKAKLSTAHNYALEEAAHLIECDGHAMSVSEAAAAIRALKT